VNADLARLLAELFTVPKTLALGVVLEGAPYLGLLPFAVSADRTTAYVHVSRLARHTAGLSRGARVCALLHLEPSSVPDALQIPRLILSGVAEPLDPGSPEYKPARALYEERFPGMSATFSLGDFVFVALRFERGRLVSGFAKVRDLTAADLVPERTESA